MKYTTKTCGASYCKKLNRQAINDRTSEKRKSVKVTTYGKTCPFGHNVRFLSIFFIKGDLMKVIELVRMLNTCNPNSEVILQKDGEGNDYSPLSAVDNNCIYEPENTWSGDVLSLAWSAEDCCLDEEEWEEKKKKHTPALILIPTN